MLQSVVEQLDYTIETAEERANLVNSLLSDPDIMEYLSTYFYDVYGENPTSTTYTSISNFLDFLSNYILFSPTEPKEKDINNPRTQRDRDRRSLSIEEQEEKGNQTQSKHSSRNSPSSTAIKITPKDLSEYPDIAELHNFATRMTEHWKNEKLPFHKRYKCKKISQETRAMMKDLKKSYKNYISYSLQYTPIPEINYYNHTFYPNGNGEPRIVSYNRLELSNPQHVENLILHYASLRQCVFEDPSKTINFFLMSLEENIENAELTPQEQFILLKRVDGLTYEKIAEQYEQRFHKKMHSNYLSQVFRNIAAKVAEQEKSSFVFWVCTRMRREFKKCTRCRMEKPAIPYFFPRDKKGKSGMASICKKCRNKQRRKKYKT